MSTKTGTVYYQPLATDRIFSVPTSALRKGPLQAGETLPVTVVGRKSSQGLALEIEENSNAILFSPFTETAIALWQPETNNQRYKITQTNFFATNLALDFCTTLLDKAFYLFEKRNIKKFFLQKNR